MLIFNPFQSLHFDNKLNAGRQQGSKMTSFMRIINAVSKMFCVFDIYLLLNSGR